MSMEDEVATANKELFIAEGHSHVVDESLAISQSFTAPKPDGNYGMHVVVEEQNGRPANIWGGFVSRGRARTFRDQIQNGFSQKPRVVFIARGKDHPRGTSVK
jgi:hypothetical protein